MPRMARVVVDGGTYHIMTSGNNGQPIFQEDADRQRYLQLLSSYLRKAQLKMYHYALMPKHVHLVLQVSEACMLSRAMPGLNLSYSLFYRKRYGYRGHLWQGRFKSLSLDRDTQLLEYGRSVELHPIRAGLATDPLSFPWSSYRHYAEGFMDKLLTPHPLYQNLGPTPLARQLAYRYFVQEGIRQPFAARRFISSTNPSPLKHAS